MKSINIDKSADKRIIFVIDNTGIIENFEMINVEDLEEIVMSLPKKKGLKKKYLAIY